MPLNLGGVLKIFLVRYVPPRFSKVESPELIFFFHLKLWSPERIFAKFVSQVLKFSQNRQKLGLKMQNHQKIEVGVSGAGKELEMVGPRS